MSDKMTYPAKIILALILIVSTVLLGGLFREAWGGGAQRGTHIRAHNRAHNRAQKQFHRYVRRQRYRYPAYCQGYSQPVQNNIVIINDNSTKTYITTGRAVERGHDTSGSIIIRSKEGVATSWKPRYPAEIVP